MFSFNPSSSSQSVVGIAVESCLWIRNCLCNTVQKSESFVEIWAVFKSLNVETFKTFVLMWNISSFWCSSWCSLKISQHVIGWVNSSHTGIVMLWAIDGWLSNLFWWGDTTVSCNIVNAVSWDIVWCSWIISINICWFPIVPWPWVEVWKRSSLVLVVVFMMVVKFSTLSTSKKESNCLCIFH